MTRTIEFICAYIVMVCLTIAVGLYAASIEVRLDRLCASAKVSCDVSFGDIVRPRHRGQGR